MASEKFSQPLRFEHPEKLEEGLTVQQGNITAKSFINEENGEVKFNMVINNGQGCNSEIKRSMTLGRFVEAGQDGQDGQQGNQQEDQTI